MPDLLPFGQEIRYVSFHEGKKYSKQNIVTAIVEATGLTEEEAEGNIYQRIKQLKTEKGLLQITGDEHKFSFVGISLVRNTETIESIPNIVIAVYPKWRKIDSSSEQSSSFFNQFFFSSLHSYSKFREKKKEYFHREEIGADFRVWGSGRAHVFDCMLALVADVNRFGIIHEYVHVEHSRKGKTNWQKTFRKGKVMISGNTPYYLNPIRTKKSKLYNEISQIHQEVFSHSMTVLSSYFTSPSVKISWQKKMTLNHIPRKINAVKQALRTTKVQKQRERLNNLLRVLDAKAYHSQQKEEIVGITSRGFNGLWEQALLEVIGDVSRTNMVNNLVHKRFSLQLISEGETEWKQEYPKRHVIDGLAFSRNNNVILFDAKNYKNWNGLGIGDVLKQYAYERLLTKIKETDSDQPSWDQDFLYSSFDYLRNEIIANVFVFPLNSIGTSEEETDVDVQMVGRYNIDYMREVVDNDLICVEINPDMVLKQYSENSRALHSRFIEVVTDSAVNDSTNT